MAEFSNTDQNTVFANKRVAVNYAFSHYHHNFTSSPGIKNDISSQECYSNYQYHKSLGVTFNYRYNDKGQVVANNNDEKVWTTIVQTGSRSGGNILVDENGTKEAVDGVTWLWKTSNSAVSAKETDYDPCPPGYILPTATHVYQAHLAGTSANKTLTGAGSHDYAGKYVYKNGIVPLWFPASGQLWNGYNNVVGERAMFWVFYYSTYDYTKLFRRAQMYYSDAGTKGFTYDMVPWPAAALSIRCRKFTKN